LLLEHHYRRSTIVSGFSYKNYMIIGTVIWNEILHV
jgi:hypothetical protein